MKLIKETETLEYKKTTSELKNSMKDISAILNKHGEGILYFGVKPDGTVIGQEIGNNTLNEIATRIKDAIEPYIFPTIKEETIDGKTVVKVEFKGNEKPYSANGKYYIRVSDRSELMSQIQLKYFLYDNDNDNIWENFLTDADISDVDTLTLEKFYKEAVECSRLPVIDKYSHVKLLTHLNLMKDGKLTRAGYFLFSNKKPITLKLAIFVTDARIRALNNEIIQGNIFELIYAGINYIKTNINWAVEINGWTPERQEIPEVPVDAIREIVVNAFAHANYAAITQHEINITPTRINILNPGGFAADRKPEDFLNSIIPSKPRNKTILRILYLAKMVENIGLGIRNVLTICRDEKIKYEYESTLHDFRFTFFRKKQSDYFKDYEQNSSAQNKFNLNQIEKIILRLIKSDPNFTIKEMAVVTSKADKTISRALKNLKEKGFIERSGSNKIGEWRIIKNIK